MSRPEKISSDTNTNEAIYAFEGEGTFGDWTRVTFLETIAQNLYAAHDTRQARNTGVQTAFEIAIEPPAYMSVNDVRAFCRTAENRGGGSVLSPEIVRAFDVMMERFGEAFKSDDIDSAYCHAVMVQEMNIFNRSLPRDYGAVRSPFLTLTRHGLRLFTTMTASMIQHGVRERAFEMPFFGLAEK